MITGGISMCAVMVESTSSAPQPDGWESHQVIDMKFMLRHCFLALFEWFPDISVDTGLSPHETH